MDAIDLVRELNGTKCQCGKPKKSGNTFCAKCYYTLPRSMQSALYRRVGEGYEEAYEAAIQLLQPRS